MYYILIYAAICCKFFYTINSSYKLQRSANMILLPDMTIEGHAVSLQAPYTINGYLITEIQEQEFISCNSSSSYQVIIGYINTEDNMVKSVWLPRSSFQVSSKTYQFLLVHGPGCDEEGGKVLEDNRAIHYEEWFEHVKEQVEVFARMAVSAVLRSESYIKLVKRLIKQNRADKYLQYYPYNTLCFLSSSSDENFNTDNVRRGARATIINGEEFFSQLAETMRQRMNESRERICNFTYPEPNKKYIHPYDYTPEYIKHTDDPSSLLLGVEIEVGGNKKPNELANREKIVKRCIQIMNGSESDQEDLIYSTSDSSVQIELDTMPCSLTHHKKINYKELFDFLDKEGYKGHDCEKAGLHVHANRDYLGDTEFQQQITITKIIYLLEKFNNEICVIARRDKNYSPFSGQSEDNPIEKFNRYKQKGKNVALNLQHSETIEFRCFKSTLKYESFILILEFVQCIIDFAKSINIEEVESVTWNDLMRKFPTSVTEYYYERLKKIEKKLAKKKRKELNKMKKEWEKEKNPLHKKKSSRKWKGYGRNL